MFSYMQNISLVLAGEKIPIYLYFALSNKMKGNNLSRNRDEVPLSHKKIINQIKGIQVLQGKDNSSSPEHQGD